MKKLLENKYLRFAPLIVVELAMFLLKRNSAKAVELMMMAVLLLFGYLAAMVDITEKRIPNKLVGAMLGAWILIIVPQLFVQTEYALVLIISDFAGFVMSGLLFLIVYMVSRKGLGGGDVKFMAVAGLYLGARAALATMLYGSILAAVTGGILILSKRMTPKGTIPLAPFLYIGMILAMFI